MQWRAEALLVTLAHTLAEMESEKFGDRVADVEGVAYTIRRLKVNTLVDSEMSPIFFPDFREVSSLIVCQVFLESPVCLLKLF